MGLNIFNSVKLPGIKRNRFDLSHDVKMSFSMGELVPTCVMEALPGDRFNISVENMLRFAPLIAPVMHKVNVTTHYYFVPTRILWDQWEKWITRELDVEAPYVNLSPGHSYLVGGLQDYLGYPTTEPVVSSKMSPLPIAAYYKIFDEYYRDQNLVTERFTPVVAGVNTAYQGNFDLLRRAWMHDYFTSALPFAQKGDSVQLPLVDQGPIPVTPVLGDDPALLINIGTGGDAAAGALSVGAYSPDANALKDSSGNPVTFDFNGNQVVDIQADAVDINTFRRALKLQEWLEKNARGGTRYVESILSHFGVKSSDKRLQRPEYIGGSKQNMVISEVLATAETTAADVPVGNMAGHGISVGGGNTFSYQAEEHGYVIGIINVQPVTAYQQGLHRSLFRFDPLDYAWPTFANIGEQEVLEQEVFYAAANPDFVFGYVPRYAEYKFMNSRVAGEMKDSLSYWHLGRIFDGPPELTEEFVTCNPDPRIFAVVDPGADHIYSHIFNNISVQRALPRFGIPTI